MMEKIGVLKYHGGSWTDELIFVDYDSCGLIFDTSSVFLDFERFISENIEVANENCKLNFQFKMSSSSSPLRIFNDMSLQFYFYMRNSTSNPLDFPAYVSTVRDAVICNAVVDEVLDSNVDNFASELDVEHCRLLGLSLDDDNSLYLRNVRDKVLEDMDIHDEVFECVENDLACGFGIAHSVFQSFEVNQAFRNKESLKDAMTFYAIKNKFQYKVLKSCPKQFWICCINDTCSWYMKTLCRRNSGCFISRNLVADHSCNIVLRNSDKRQVTRSVVAKIIKNPFISHKRIYTPNDIVSDMRDRLGTEINYQKDWQAKDIAMNMIRGSTKQAYSELPRLLYMVQSTNPGLVVSLELKGNKFLYLFVAIHASIKAWDHCPPIVVVDATFLKSCYGGTLIFASSPDSNVMILPVTFAIVDGENDSSWDWFFRKFIDAFKEREGMIIVSDRHQSIQNACENVIPDIPHVVCTYHLLKNMKLRFKSNIKDMSKYFKLAYEAYTLKDFEDNMFQLANINPEIPSYLKEVGFQRWTRLYSLRKRFITMTSNLAESLNSMIMEAKSMPITTLVEFLIGMLQDLFYRHRKLAIQTRSALSPRQHLILLNLYDLASKMEVIPSTNELVAVSKGGNKYVVDMVKKTCTCQRFQLNELPCMHALVYIKKFHLSSDVYSSVYYSKAEYVATYEGIVFPIPSRNSWDTPREVSERIILPPEAKIRVGRPRKHRIRSYLERKTRAKVKCGTYKQSGHNRRSCSGVKE